MRIKSLKIKNGGRHKEINFDCDASIAGVIGPNGSGKSTILSLLEWVLTGRTEDTGSSYVRDYKGNCVVEAEFVKDGKIGQIIRQVGSTPKRSLKWDGRTMTAAKEVDATMKAIFGADREAVTNAVFIRQGVLENILFVLDSNRKKSFIQLVNLAYCAKRAEVVDGKIKRLEDTIVDHQPSMDLATANRKAVIEKLDDLRAKSDNVPDWTSEIKFIDEQNTAAKRHGELTAELGTVVAGIEAEDVFLASRLAELGFTTIDGLKAKIANDETEEKTCESEITRIQNVRNEFVHFDRVVRQIGEFSATVASLDAETKQINPNNVSIEGWQQAKRQVEDQLNTHAELGRLNVQWGQQSARVKKLKDDCDALRAPATSKEAIAEAETIHSTETSNAYWLIQIRDARRKMAGCVKGVRGQEVKCPNCDLVVADGGDLDPAEIALLTRRIGDLEIANRDRYQKIVSDKSAWSVYDTKRNTLLGSFNTADEQLKATEERLSTLSLPARTEDELKAEKKTIKDTITRLQAIPRERTTASKNHFAAINEKRNYKLAAAHNHERENFDQSLVVNFTRARTALQESLRDLRGQLNVLTGKLAQVTEKEKQKGRIELALAEVNERLAARQPEGSKLHVVQDHLMRMGGVDCVTWEAMELAVRNRQNEFVELKGEIKAVELQYDEANKHFHEIKKRIEKDQKKLTVIEDLRKLRALLLDDGLPMAFVRYQFEHLARITQEGLSRLGANFCVTIDRSRDLAFTFQRLDDPEQTTHEMGKLSGGQRVRLCLAFLMAVQQRLVREIGLLVLDEPSVHCDDEGKEQIAAFIKGLREGLQNTDHQIWVVDHAYQLKDAIEKYITLENP